MRAIRQDTFLILRWIMIVVLAFGFTGCMVISTAGTVATTAAKSAIGIAGEVVETGVDVATPGDGEKKVVKEEK